MTFSQVEVHCISISYYFVYTCTYALAGVFTISELHISLQEGIDYRCGCSVLSQLVILCNHIILFYCHSISNFCFSLIPWSYRWRFLKLPFFHGNARVFFYPIQPYTHHICHAYLFFSCEYTDTQYYTLHTQTHSTLLLKDNMMPLLAHVREYIWCLLEVYCLSWSNGITGFFDTMDHDISITEVINIAVDFYAHNQLHTQILSIFLFCRSIISISCFSTLIFWTYRWRLSKLPFNHGNARQYLHFIQLYTHHISQLFHLFSSFWQSNPSNTHPHTLHTKAQTTLEYEDYMMQIFAHTRCEILVCWVLAIYWANLFVGHIDIEIMFLIMDVSQLDRSDHAQLTIYIRVILEIADAPAGLIQYQYAISPNLHISCKACSLRANLEEEPTYLEDVREHQEGRIHCAHLRSSLHLMGTQHTSLEKITWLYLWRYYNFHCIRNISRTMSVIYSQYPLLGCTYISFELNCYLYFYFSGHPLLGCAFVCNRLGRYDHYKSYQIDHTCIIILGHDNFGKNTCREEGSTRKTKMRKKIHSTPEFRKYKSTQIQSTIWSPYTLSIIILETYKLYQLLHFFRADMFRPP